MTILLPMASSDMAAMRGLAEVVSEQADAASLQMVVAKLPDGSATTFNDGQTMLHVLVKAANEYIEVRCSLQLAPHRPHFLSETVPVFVQRLISTPKSKTYLRLICGTPASYHQQRFLCDLSMARGGRGCTTCDAEFARRKELFKVSCIDNSVPQAHVVISLQTADKVVMWSAGVSGSADRPSGPTCSHG